MEVTLFSAPFPDLPVQGQSLRGAVITSTQSILHEKIHVCNGRTARHLLSGLVFSYTKYRIAGKGHRLAIFQACEHTAQAEEIKGRLNHPESNVILYDMSEE